MMASIDRLLDLALMPSGTIPDSAMVYARLSLFDWLVCGRAGIGEPLARILRDELTGEGGRAAASVFGGGRLPARAAALVNGATSHALDYDDTHFGHVGHPSVAIYPAALAAGELVEATARAVAEAFLIGAEVSVRVGIILSSAHYNRGFHQTATAGAFGATIAAGRLLKLDPAQMRVAIGLCATRASGLKSQFGTMGKPYNAGIAAANGIECARLALAGFTSADDGLMGPQGFVPTHSDAIDEDAAWQATLPGTFLFEDIKYKLHACCHGTHAMIEALAPIAGTVGATSVRAIRLRTSPRWLSVCDIKVPRTGLEVKFSYNWLAGMVFHAIPTASDRVFTDDLAVDPRLTDFAQRITVAGDAAVGDMQAEGEVELLDGSIHRFSHDLGALLAEAKLICGLRAKAEGLIGDKAEAIWNMVAGLDHRTAADIGRIVEGP